MRTDFQTLPWHMRQSWRGRWKLVPQNFGAGGSWEVAGVAGGVVKYYFRLFCTGKELWMMMMLMMMLAYPLCNWFSISSSN